MPDVANLVNNHDIASLFDRLSLQSIWMWPGRFFSLAWALSWHRAYVCKELVMHLLFFFFTEEGSKPANSS